MGLAGLFFMAYSVTVSVGQRATRRTVGGACFALAVHWRRGQVNTCVWVRGCVWSGLCACVCVLNAQPGPTLIPSPFFFFLLRVNPPPPRRPRCLHGALLHHDVHRPLPHRDQRPPSLLHTGAKGPRGRGKLAGGANGNRCAPPSGLQGQRTRRLFDRAPLGARDRRWVGYDSGSGLPAPVLG